MQRGPEEAGAGGASRACFVCGQLGHLAARCSRRVLPLEAVAAAVDVEAGGVGAVDAEEFRAFQEWRSAVQAAEGQTDGNMGVCAWDNCAPHPGK
jgi:hypothetical protein